MLSIVFSGKFFLELICKIRICADYASLINNKYSFKANICVVFFVENTVRMVLYGMWGILTLESLKQVVVLIPFMLVGLFLGMWSGQRVNDRIAKKLVLILLIVSGVAILLT